MTKHVDRLCCFSRVTLHGFARWDDRPDHAIETDCAEVAQSDFVCRRRLGRLLEA